MQAKKFESTRGVGHSFGANRNERPEDIVTATELVRSFADIVAKNGNLLIGIGPDEHGRFPEQQLVPLRGLGAWLRINGEAIYRTRPWERAETTTTAGAAVRFTQRDGAVHAIMLDVPEREFALRGVDATDVRAVRLLGQLWGPQPIRIGAQAHLERFYQRHGFVPDDKPYVEDGIPHIEMLRP